MLPTDTVYGIGADAFDPAAVQRAARRQGPRPRDAAAGAGQRRHHARRARRRGPGYARALVEEFWPGPLTLVCHQQASLQWDLGDTRGTVAVRMPDHDGRPRAPRAHRPAGGQLGQPAPASPAATDADQAEEMLGDDVAVIVDAGPSPGRRGLHDRRRHRRPGPGAAPRRALAGAAQRGARAARRHASTDEG